jgi:hypothetical protein
METGEQMAAVEAREIETVTGDFHTEPGKPFYRVEIDGYCADFDYREAAENFAQAINGRTATLQATVERQAAEIARYREVLSQIVGGNQVREWTAVSGKTDAEWVYYDGQYAKIARQALEDNNG